MNRHTELLPERLAELKIAESGLALKGFKYIIGVIYHFVVIKLPWG